jgi:hypothetical protein
MRALRSRPRRLAGASFRFAAIAQIDDFAHR